MPETCTRCGAKIKDGVKNIKWLELSHTDGRYYHNLPEGHVSQGGFPFGTSCATTQLKETISELKSLEKAYC